MVTNVKDGNEFPEVRFLEGWPRNRPTLGTLVPTIFAIAFSVLAIFNLANIPLGEGPLVAAGSCGMVVAMLGVATIFVSILPRIIPRRDPGVRSIVHKEFGTGVRLSISRMEHLRTIPLMTGLGVYGFCAWLDWHRNNGSNLLPLSKAGDTGATVALIFAAIAALSIAIFAILPVFLITIDAYPSGILRSSAIRTRKRPERFIPWNCISSLVADQFNSGNAKNIPTIRVYVTEPFPVSRDEFPDEPGVIGLPMNMVRCDTNSFFSLATLLKENPEYRHLLASQDIGQWFLQVERNSRLK